MCGVRHSHIIFQALIALWLYIADFFFCITDYEKPDNHLMSHSMNVSVALFLLVGFAAV